MPKEKGYISILWCSESTKRLICEDCVEEFLKHNPKFRGMNITQNFILKKIAEWYLDID